MPIEKQNNVDAARQREISKTDSLRLSGKPHGIQPSELEDENHYEPEPFGGVSGAGVSSFDSGGLGGGFYTGLNQRNMLTSTKGKQKSFESMKSTPPADSDLFKF